jgi:hypothetical protein
MHNLTDTVCIVNCANLCSAYYVQERLLFGWACGNCVMPAAYRHPLASVGVLRWWLFPRSISISRLRTQHPRPPRPGSGRHRLAAAGGKGRLNAREPRIGDPKKVTSGILGVAFFVGAHGGGDHAVVGSGVMAGDKGIGIPWCGIVERHRGARSSPPMYSRNPHTRCHPRIHADLSITTLIGVSPVRLHLSRKSLGHYS